MKTNKPLLFLLSTLIYCPIGCQKDPIEPDPAPVDTLSIISFHSAIARVADTVRIYGTGFGSSLAQVSVKVGTIASQVIFVSDSTISIVILAGTQSGLIHVTAGLQSAASLTVLTIDNSVPVPWSEKAPFPQQMPDGLGYIPAVGISAGNKGFYYKSNQLWEYLPATNTWVQKASRPFAGTSGVSYSTGFVINGTIYIALTNIFDGADSVQLWAYSISGNSWLRKKRFPGGDRVAPFSFALNGKGYVGGGQKSVAGFLNYKDVWKYDPAADAWSQVADYPGAVTLGISGFTIGDFGYVLDAGPGNPRAPTSGSGSTGKLYCYTDTSDTWLQKASLPAPAAIVSAACFSVQGRGYAVVTLPSVGNTAPVKQDFWEYNPSTNLWRQRTDAGGALRWFASAFSIANKAYVGLGTGNTFDSKKLDFWEYTPEQ